MCGIAGLINLDGKSIDPNILKAMTDAVAHRGPDGEGQWIAGPIGIGHRRLAVIDLSSQASQPMISNNKRYVLSYNGEIYNFLEIRKELEKKGYKFYSNSDTEVVLNAIIEWNSNALLKFNGMFSLCFWDNETKKLLLARDRYGIKPLYISKQGKIFSFGSEQKSIITHPLFKKELDKEALLEYFTFQNILSEKTLFENITMLPAGCCGTIDLGKKNPSFSYAQYWDYNFNEPKKKNL